VIVGDTGVFRVDTYPFGAVKGSGLGREGVRWAMESMTEPRMPVLSLRRHCRVASDGSDLVVVFRFVRFGPLGHRKSL
jgi:hypothetical protein